MLCLKEVRGTKFCYACGTKISETIFCPGCGGQTSTEFAFCQKCGAAIAGDAGISAAPAETVKGKKNILQALPKKAVIFGGIGVIALVIIILVASMFFGGGSNDNYSLYLKDGEIIYTDYSDEGALEITSRLLNGASKSGTELSNSASTIGYFITFSDNGNRIFFPDRITDEDDGITLYYRDINKPKEEPVKIDSNVMMYAINNAGTQVVYVKGSDKILYLHDLTNKKKISSDVISFDVADDCKKIGYRTEENSYYLWYADKDSVKLASDITSIEYVATDLSAIYYIKDGSLYKQAEGSDDKEKIAADISRVVAIYDSGEVYYIRAESTEKNLLDYVDDNLAASDAALTEPQYPVYPNPPNGPSWWDFDTNEAYDAAKAQYEVEYEAYEATRDQMRTEYEAAYQAYDDKRNRDYLREDLRNATMESTEYTLYYSNGTEGTIVTDALVDQWDITYAYDKPVMILQAYNQSEVRKVKLTEISNSYEVSDLVNAALYSSSERYVAIGSTMLIVEQTDATNFKVSSDGTTVYFLDDVSDDGYGDLYKIAITNGQASNPERYDSNVSNQAIFFTASDKLAYYKDVSYKDYKGDLFINGEEIDYDVRLWSISHLNDNVLYYTDWNSEKSYGTLKMFKNGTKTKVADDVHDFDTTNDGDILYLYDYSTNYYTGTLYLYNNGEPRKIDDDVAALIPVYKFEIMGKMY